MKLKLDEKGAAVLQEGKPVYIHDDGKELPFDAAATVQTIGRLNAEARSHRERAEQYEAKWKPFDGIEDAEAARKALATVKNLDDKKLVDAGEVDRIKSEAIKATEEKYRPYQKKADQFEQQIRDFMIGGGFKGSQFATSRFAAEGQAGAEIAQALFGNRFKVENDRVVGYDSSGNKLYSRVRAGELADFDEALEMIVDAYPHKAQILKGSGASGSGAVASNQTSGGKKTISRAQFNALDANAQRMAAIEASQGKAAIVD